MITASLYMIMPFFAACSMVDTSISRLVCGNGRFVNTDTFRCEPKPTDGGPEPFRLGSLSSVSSILFALFMPIVGGRWTSMGLVGAAWFIVGCALMVWLKQTKKPDI